MQLLLDSSVLIDVLRARKNRRGELAEMVESGHILGVAAVNVAEVYAAMRPAEEDRTTALFEGLSFYPMSLSIARLAGRLRNKLALKGKTVSLADMMVAATALEHGLYLMTDNRKDFAIDELKLL